MLRLAQAAWILTGNQLLSNFGTLPHQSVATSRQFPQCTVCGSTLIVHPSSFRALLLCVFAQALVISYFRALLLCVFAQALVISYFRALVAISLIGQHHWKHSR